MAGQLRIAGGELTLPSNVIIDADIATDAAVQSSKLLILNKIPTQFDLDILDTPVAAEKVVYVCHATNGANVREVGCGLWATSASTNITFVFKKWDGSSTTMATQNISGSNDKVIFNPVLSNETLTVDDIVTVELIVTNAAGTTGAFAWVAIEEEGISA